MIQELPQVDIKSLHTKQLLNLRDSFYGTNYVGKWDEEPEEYKKFRQAVLDELNTREHVPGKVEAKEIRKKKQLAKQNYCGHK